MLSNFLLTFTQLGTTVMQCSLANSNVSSNNNTNSCLNHVTPTVTHMRKLKPLLQEPVALRTAGCCHQKLSNPWCHNLVKIQGYRPGMLVLQSDVLWLMCSLILLYRHLSFFNFLSIFTRCVVYIQCHHIGGMKTDHFFLYVIDR